MNESLDELIAQAEDIIACPEDKVYQPLIMLKLLTAMAREVQAMRRVSTHGTPRPRHYTDDDHQVWADS